MVSLAQGNTLRKSAFCLGFSLKIIVSWLLNYFLRSNILKKISSKISSRRLPPKKSVSSVCSVDKFQMIPPKPSLDPHHS